MININEFTNFETVLRDAQAKTASSPRWAKAISKAVEQMDANGTFMSYDGAEQALLIWSQGSNEIYSANGVCQCKAYEKGFPCWHRAAARLIQNCLKG